MNTKDFLAKMSNAAGVAGYESAEVAGIIKEAFLEFCDSVETDTLGNVVALKKGKGKSKVAFFSHMDEIGLVVTSLDKNGFVNFSQIGGYDQRTLIAQEVIIHGRERVYGVIGIKPPHLNAPGDAQKSLKLHEMQIDTGYSDEKLRELVRVGDVITIKREFVSLKGDVVSGKALDDRACVAAMYQCAVNLKDFNHDADIYFVSTTREEVGSQGATVATYNVQPDIGIALDVCHARTPDMRVPNPNQGSDFGKGPVIGMGPNMQPRVVELLKKTAKDNGIPFQIEVTTANSGTDARAVQISREGVASGLISLPLKYMHTSVETITMKDLLAAGKLMSGLIMKLNGADLEELLCL